MGRRKTVPPPVSAVYIIRNRATGRAYIGSCTDIRRRWYMHRRELDIGEHRNAPLQADWKAQGPDAFEWRVIRETDDLDMRLQIETDLITEGMKAGTLYNLRAYVDSAVTLGKRRKQDGPNA